MLTEIYIEALLVEEELADQVWEAWDAGEIDDQVAWLGWWMIADPIKVGHVSCTATCEFSSIWSEQRGDGKALLERDATMFDEWKAHWKRCSGCGEKVRPIYMKLQVGMCGKCAPFIYVFRTGVVLLIASIGGLGLLFLIDNPIDMIVTGDGTPRGRMATTLWFIVLAFVGLWGLYYTIWSFSRIGKTSKQGSNRYMLENNESETAYMLEDKESETDWNMADKIVAMHLYGAAAGFMISGIGFFGREVYVSLKSGEWQAWTLRQLLEKVWPWLNNPEDWLGWHKIAYVFLDLMPVSVTFFLIGWIVKVWAKAEWEAR